MVLVFGMLIKYRSGHQRCRQRTSRDRAVHRAEAHLAEIKAFGTGLLTMFPFCSSLDEGLL